VSAYHAADEQATATSNLDAAVLKAIVTGTPGQSTNRIRGKVGARYSDLMASLGRLTACGKVRVEKGGKGAKLWFPGVLLI
jgi:hypothetical protein